MTLVAAVVAGVPARLAAEPDASDRARRGSTSTELLAAIERSRLVVVGRIGQLRQLDAHGHAAAVWSETALGPRGEKVEPGTGIPFAWEELARDRPPRFENRERVLVCVETLPTASIWRTRIADPHERRQTYGLAADGECFVRDPDAETVERIAAWLALPATSRDGADGVAQLVALAEVDDPAVAAGAVARLAAIPTLDDSLGDADAERVVALLVRDGAGAPDAARDVDDGLARALVRLVETRSGPHLDAALDDALESALDRADALPDARLFEAVALRRGALPEDAARRLREHPDAAYRTLAARHAPADGARDALAKALADDPTASVRAAAAARLAELEGDAAIAVEVSALDDTDPLVRNTAARAIAALPGGVVALRAVVFAGVDDGAPNPGASPGVSARHAAIGGLGAAGHGGRRVLVEVARDHPDATLRRLAKMALGYVEPEH